MLEKIKFKNSLYKKFIDDYKDLIEKYGSDYPEKKDEYKLRINNALFKYLPFIKSLTKNKYENVLEIGSGFGSVTLGLSKLSTNLTCLEISEEPVKFLKDSSQLGKVSFINDNSANISIQDMSFDLVVYSASLEHMTLEEREESLSKSWKYLKKGGHLVILECPNLYWFMDEHSTRLLFNSWQREEIAFRHTAKTPRKSFQNIYDNINDKNQLKHWLRRGRPVSREEIELYTGISFEQRNHKIYSLEQFLGWRFLIRRFTYGFRYNVFSLFLKSLKVEEAFCHPFFTVTIKK